MPFPKIELEVGGEKIEGWKSLSVSMGMDRAVRAFQLSAATRQQTFRPGQACRMLLDGEPVVTGYIDSVRSAYSKNQHSTAIAGRSKTADLVDCSVPRDQWKNIANINIAELANRYATPFGIDVHVHANVLSRLKPIAKYKPDPGVRVFEAIEFLARQAGVLVMDDADGNLVLADAGQAGRVAEALMASQTGWTVLSATVESNFAQRYSEYCLLSKTGVSWTGDNSEEVKHSCTTALDEGVSRFRPLIENAEEALNLNQAQDRVLWRANVNAGKSFRVNVSVNGWRNPDGDIWKSNTLLQYRDVGLGVNRELVIVSVDLSVSENGVITRLVMSPVSAYALLPTKKDTVTLDDGEAATFLD